MGGRTPTETGPQLSTQVLQEKADLCVLDIKRREVNSCGGGKSWGSTSQEHLVSCGHAGRATGAPGRGSRSTKAQGMRRQRW